MAYDFNREVEEAIRAGERALISLRDAQSYLKSAGNWGLLDMFGGNFLTGVIKHTKLSNASSCMDAARRDLKTFSRELDDVDEYLPEELVGGFLTFADFFFDGFVADIFVQSKIADARKQVDEAIYQVETIVERLKRTI